MKQAIDFDGLFVTHHRKMTRMVSRIVGVDHAEDVAQLAWRNAWKYRDGFEGTAAASSWLYRIATNTALSFLRSQKRFKREDPIDDRALEIPDIRISPEKAMLLTERRALLRAALSTLPRKTQAAMVQIYVLGRSQSDVIAASKEPSGTMKSRLNRGRKLVKESMLMPLPPSSSSPEPQKGHQP